MKLSEAAKEKRNQYYREYRKRNPEKIREIAARYWEKKSQEQPEEENEG